MATTKILKHTVETAEPRADRYVLFDAVVPGFGLRVYPTGKKVWIFAYRPWPGGAGTPKKTALIGTVDDFTPDQARRRADDMRALVRTGKDPQADKAEQREAPTVGDVADKFLEQHVKAKRSAGTYASYSDILNRILIPKFGSRKARALAGRDVSALHQEWSETPYQANRILAVTSSMYSWASGAVALVPKGTNPAQGIERFDEEERGRVLSNDELERLGAAIRLAETTGVPWTINPDGEVKHVPKANQHIVIGPHVAAALRLLILTGARLREILNLKWADVDFERGLLLIGQHKARRTAGTKSIVLNAPALEVLETIPRIGVYVIAGDTAGQHGEKPRADLKRPWALVRKEAKLEDLRIHDHRRNFGGFGAGGGAGLYVIGKLLGHSAKNPKTTARYSHLANDPLRKATDTIGTAIAAAMGEGRAAEGGQNVIPIREKRNG